MPSIGEYQKPAGVDISPAMKPSATVVSLGWLEPILSILLLLTTLGYTVHKWYLLKNKK
jgi:hypothetical protein